MSFRPRSSILAERRNRNPKVCGFEPHRGLEEKGEDQMCCWDYRIIKVKDEGSESGWTLGIYEVYYNGDYSIVGISGPEHPFGETPEDLQDNIDQMREALSLPHLILHEIEFQPLPGINKLYDGDPFKDLHEDDPPKDHPNISDVQAAIKREEEDTERRCLALIDFRLSLEIDGILMEPEVRGKIQDAIERSAERRKSLSTNSAKRSTMEDETQ